MEREVENTSELFPSRTVIEKAVYESVESMLTIRGRTVAIAFKADLARDVGLSEEDIVFVRMRCSSRFLVSLQRYRDLNSCAAISEAIYAETERLRRIGTEGLARACFNAFKTTGDDMLLMAMRVFKAMGEICLKGAEKTEPFPWRFEESDEDAPIRDAKSLAVLRRDSGFYPPEMGTCKAIKECVNLVHDVQKVETPQEPTNDCKR